jgi:O-antigen ligase
MSNASALFRSLLVYGLCLPLAIFLGYLLANPLDLATVSVVTVLFFILTIPLLLRWHHAWLIATWNTTAMLFFLPGKPQVWIGLAGMSLLISILQYTLNRKMRFLSVPPVARPLFFLAVVIALTARLTGGLGMKIFGGDTYGGRRYITELAAIAGYFAIINRRIPPKKAGLYIALFFLGAASLVIADLPGVVSPSLNFLFLIFPVSSVSAFTDQNSVVAQTALISRVAGIGALGLAVIYVMLARHGLRGALDASKPWRLGIFCFFVLACMSTGFRGGVVTILMLLASLFYLERLHHTRLLLPVILGLLMIAGLAIVFAARLPLNYQRSLTFLPGIHLDPLARLDAETSSEWRRQMWREVIPQIPQYLLIGKGYAFSGAEHAMIREGLEETEMVGNYHNGPLSVILPFGIFGSIAFVWLLVAGIRVVYRNYQFGDPAYHQINKFLFVYFVVRVILFFAVFGALEADLPMFLGLLGLSISLNGGVAKPMVVPWPTVEFSTEYVKA